MELIQTSCRQMMDDFKYHRLVNGFDVHLILYFKIIVTNNLFNHFFRFDSKENNFNMTISSIEPIDHVPFLFQFLK